MRTGKNLSKTPFLGSVILWNYCLNCFRHYKSRFQCMERCHSAYQSLSPHHNLARWDTSNHSLKNIFWKIFCSKLTEKYFNFFRYCAKVSCSDSVDRQTYQVTTTCPTGQTSEIILDWHQKYFSSFTWEIFFRLTATPDVLSTWPAMSPEWTGGTGVCVWLVSAVVTRTSWAVLMTTSGAVLSSGSLLLLEC